MNVLRKIMKVIHTFWRRNTFMDIRNFISKRYGLRVGCFSSTWCADTEGGQSVRTPLPCKISNL